jgi:hypothetical protein
VDIHAEATVRWRGRISRRKGLDFTTLPCSGFVSNFDQKFFVIGSVCVALFASDEEVGDETILEGFNRG